MTERQQVADNTPVLVGAGQVVRRDATAESPMALAAEAARRAIAHAGGSGLVAAIDTICVTRLFSDSMGMPPCPFGRSDNPPLSVARAIGASPRWGVYTQAGGNEPQSRLIEFARDIARGERSLVLLAGAEAIRNQRSAERAGETLDWHDSVGGSEMALDDRGVGEIFVTRQEVSNGMLAPMQYYGLIEQARAFASGLSTAAYREAAARLLAPFSDVAAANPHAQFPQALSAEEILGAGPLNHLYTRRMVAQDGVNQAAALVLCSAGTARALGIPADHWVFLHGMAQGVDFNLSERDDPARSAVTEAVITRALTQAGQPVAAMDLVDIYSCFPCAVFSTAAFLGLPVDGSRALTLTGGLPFFGGPGNNYAMHAIAEAVSRLRAAPASRALVTSVGGFLSKAGAGVFSCRPSGVDWAATETFVSRDGLPSRAVVAAPAAGVLVSYLVNYHGGEAAQVLVLGETASGERFVATSTAAPVVAAGLAGLQQGRALAVTPGKNGALHFSLG